MAELLTMSELRIMLRVSVAGREEISSRPDEANLNMRANFEGNEISWIRVGHVSMMTRGDSLCQLHG